MRRFFAMGFLIVALTFGAAANAVGAVPTRTMAVPSHPAAVAAVTTLKWAAPFKKGTLSGKATLTISSTYKSGKLSVTVKGVKKGDHLVASIHFRTKLGKTGTIVSGSHTVTGTTGSSSFSFALSAKVRSEIKAHLKAGDTLKIRFTDGKVVATGTFKKV